MIKAVRESTTLKLILLPIIILVFKFAIGGYDFGYGAAPVISAGEFGLSFSAIMSVWLVRETKEAYFKNK